MEQGPTSLDILELTTNSGKQPINEFRKWISGMRTRPIGGILLLPATDVLHPFCRKKSYSLVSAETNALTPKYQGNPHQPASVRE